MQRLAGRLALVVAADEAVCRDIATTLANIGIAIMLAPSGTEALALLTAHQYDLVVVDFGPVLLDAADFLQQLAAFDSSLAPAVILLSPAVEQTPQVTLRSAVIAQPVDLEELERTALRLLGSESADGLSEP